MRDIKFILRDVLVEFYKHSNDYHHVTSRELIKEIVEYIDILPTICPQCHTSSDIKHENGYIECYRCGAKFN